MTLFEVDNGRLIPAQFGHAVADGLSDELLESVRSQVLEIISRPLFPITWNDLSRARNAHSPRLTALDATGQVVSVEVLDHLTSENLIAALSSLADTAALSWMDLAREYPGGIPAFRHDWLTFRDSMPPSPGAGPRLIMVVGSIDSSARSALEVLVASGVEVHELHLRKMNNGRSFLSVNPVGLRVYAHVPQILGQSADVQQIEAHRHDMPRPTTVMPPGEHSASPLATPPVPAPAQPVASTSASVPATAVTDNAAPDLSPLDTPVDTLASDSAVPDSAVDEISVFDLGEESAPEQAPAVAEDTEHTTVPVADDGEPLDVDLPQWVIPSRRSAAPAYPRLSVPSAVSESPAPNSEPTPAGAAAEDHDEATVARLGHTDDTPTQPTRTAQDGPALAAEASATIEGAQPTHSTPAHMVRPAHEDIVPVIGQDADGLRAMAVFLGEDVPLVLAGEVDRDVPMVLTVEGKVRVWYREFSNMDDALAYAGYAAIDGWAALHLGDALGPTLTEALDEINIDIMREQQRS